MAKLLLIIRKPEEGFEEPEDFKHFLKIIQRHLTFYFGWEEGVNCFIGEWDMPPGDFPGAEFYCVLQLDEGEDEPGEVT